jgi:hypothetical protein
MSVPPPPAAAPGGPWQIAFVVPALEPALETWWTWYGVGPWRVWNLSSDRLTGQEVDGVARAYGMRIAIAQWGFVEIELIEPLDDASVYAHSLVAHDGKPHVHHLHCSTHDYDGVVARFTARGRGPAMSGGMNGSRFAYLATESEVGTLLELGDSPPDWDFPAPDAVFPSDPL